MGGGGAKNERQAERDSVSCRVHAVEDVCFSSLDYVAAETEQPETGEK